MVRWPVFTDNDFLKCSWAHAVISMRESCLFLMQCCLRARKSDLFIPNYVSDLLPIDPISCNVSPAVSILFSLQNIKCLTLNIWYCFYNKYGFMRITIHYILFLCRFYTVSQLFLELKMCINQRDFLSMFESQWLESW